MSGCCNQPGLYSSTNAPVANPGVEGPQGPAGPQGPEGDSFYPGITGYTGGGNSDLDGQQLLGVEDGALYIFEPASAPNTLEMYVVETSTDATSSPDVIRAFDYADSGKVFRRKLTVLNPDLGNWTLGDGIFTHQTSGAAIALPGSVDGANGVLKRQPLLEQNFPTEGATLLVGTDHLDSVNYIQPAAPLTAITFALPQASDSRAGQVVRAVSTENIGTVTVAVVGGGTVLGTTSIAFDAGYVYSFVCLSTAGTGVWAVSKF